MNKSSSLFTITLDDLANVTGGAPCPDGFIQIPNSNFCQAIDPSGPVIPAGNFTPGEFLSDGRRRQQ